VHNRLEQRLSPRRNTMIPATIAFNGGRARVQCIIRNISDTGAKLEVKGVGQVPAAFDLLVPEHSPQPCRVVWRAMREMGVSFA